MSDTTYTMDPRGTATAAAAISQQRRPCDEVERDLAQLRLTDVPMSIAVPWSGYVRVWVDALNALGNAVGYLGDNVQVAVTNVQRSEAASSEAFGRRGKRTGI